jgi:hypothetical protein
MYHIAKGLWQSRDLRRCASSRGHPILAALLAVLCGAPASPAAAVGWDRAAWGMTVSEIAAAYGDRALHLASPIVFGDSYAEIVLRDQIFAGYPFRVYFQMDPTTHRLAHVLLERRRQYATPAIFAQVGAALREQLGAESYTCGSPADRGKPTAIDRIWRRPDETVVASYLDFAAEILLYSNDPARRILIRYSPAGRGSAACMPR